jgi:hypothetical protein
VGKSKIKGEFSGDEEGEVRKLAKQAKSFNESIEIIVNSTPAVLSPIVRTVVSELEPEAGLRYSVSEESNSASDVYRRLLIIALEVAENSQILSADCMGIITLQSLGSSQTLFRIPPRKNWRFVDAPSVLELSECKGLVNRHSFNLHWDESYFTKVLERIVSELYRLGLLELKMEKVPLGFRVSKKE